jgi:hypothetical protein
MNVEKVKRPKDLVKKIAMYIAKADANAACPCISYQPLMPDSVKKLRKF